MLPRRTVSRLHRPRQQSARQPAAGRTPEGARHLHLDTCARIESAHMWSICTRHMLPWRCSKAASAAGTMNEPPRQT